MTSENYTVQVNGEAVCASSSYGLARALWEFLLHSNEPDARRVEIKAGDTTVAAYERR
jgi:hypothetical protein